jgi:hypothetical protein
MSIDSTTPILTAVRASVGFNAPNSANVIGQNQYGMQTIWSGAGGTFEIRPTGNLLSLAELSTQGFPYLLTPGSEFVILNFQPGTGVGINRSGTNFIISVTPDTTTQRIKTQLNGVLTGSARSTINFIPGAGMGISANDTSGILNYTFSSTGATGTGHYVTTQADTSLPNSFSLGSLETGLTKLSVTANVATILQAVPNTDYMVPNDNLLGLYDVTPSNGSLFYYVAGNWNVLAPGTTGDVLTSLSSTSLGWTSSTTDVSTWSTYPAESNVLMAGFGIKNLLDPILAQDAATKNYVVTHFGEFSGANAWTGTNTFNTNLPTSTVTPTTSTQLITKAYGDATYAVSAGLPTLSGANVWTGTNTFNTNLPTSTQTPTSNTQLITKVYGDGAYDAFGAAAALLSASNAWTGSNSFNTNLPTSTATPTLSSQLITKAYADATYSTSAGDVTLAGPNAFTGNNSFNSFLPTSTVTPTTSTQLITKAYGDATYATIAGEVTLSGSNVWTGTNTYNTNLPTSTVTPTTSTQLITKAFSDATYAGLSATQTLSGDNTFSGDVIVSSGLQISTGASDGYVLTSDSSGNSSWQPSAAQSTATVTTTDATPVDLVSIAIPTNQALTIQGTVVARDSASTDATGGFFTATAINSSGVVSLAGTPFVSVNQSSTPLFNVSVSGTNIVVTVTGIALTTYDWKTSYLTILI